MCNGAWATALVFGKSHGITRDMALHELPKLDLPVRPFFYPLSSLPAYSGKKETGLSKNPIAYSVSERGIVLPSALNLTDLDLDIYCSGLKQMISK